MTPRRWGEVKAVLAAVLESPAEDRDRTLDRLCLSDPDLRREVESLLAVENRADSALETEAAPGARIRSEIFAPPPASIGAYKITRELGRGGMGVVYLGERADGEYTKQVAIKLITAGRFDPGLQKRFRRERQILARFEHPGIARFIDGAATPQGQPYFIMEYVQGRPLLDYCVTNALSIPQRLDLFLAVCDTVEHAHQRLIVHRDLKPSNILVTADRQPKLLDFGLARVLDSAALDAASEPLTQAGAPILTPAYASPEQMRGEPYTVSADVYSLGVILFELLAGKRPYDLTGLSFGEMSRVVCEQEPAVLSSAAADQATARKLKGDLDSIAAKALEKDPRRRYPTVADLSADLRRYLGGRPVRARNATFRYRAAKFLRRNRVPVLAATLAASLILAFGAVALIEARDSERRFEEVRSLAHTVMFDLHDAIAPLPGSTQARALLVRSALAYLERLSREDRGDARLSHEVALGYRRIAEVQGYGPEANLGNTQASLESFQKSAEILSRLLKADPANRALRHDSIGVLHELSTAYGSAAKWDDAARTAQESVALAAAAAEKYQDDDATYDLALAQSSLADVSTNQHRYADAIPIREKALALFQQLSDSQPGNKERNRSTAVAHKRLAALYGVTQRYQDAEREYQKARIMDEARMAFGPSSDMRAKLDLSYDYSDLGWVSSHLNDDRTALAWLEKALALRELAAKADPSDQRAADSVASITGRIAAAQRRLGELDPALLNAQKALELWKQRAARPGASYTIQTEVADAHAEIADNFAARANCSRAASEYDQARAIYATLRDRGTLPKAENSKIDEYAAKSKSCGKSD